MDDIRKRIFQGVSTLVVKVGTTNLTDKKHRLSMSAISHLVDEVSGLADAGYNVVLVSSGAVGVGMGTLGLEERPKELAVKQACAAIGQIKLMQIYSDLFAKKNKAVAQLLLTGDDFRNRERFHNIRATVKTLLDRKVIPIVNENDTVATEEIKVGDNDKLSADVAQFLEADLLVILSDEDGLYTKNPKQYADAVHLPVVQKITPEIMRMAGGTGSKASVGGMKAKLTAIGQAVEGGTPAVLTLGAEAQLLALVKGAQVGTLFLPSPDRIPARKRWLAFVSRARGKLMLDEGAVKAVLTRKVSVLGAGIKKVTGKFQAGDLVDICSSKGEILGRGLSTFSSTEIDQIKGLHSADVAAILGRTHGTKIPSEVVHRDNLVVY